jgi:adenylosuccinate lyase
MEQSVGEYDLSYPEGRVAFIEESKRVAALFAMAPTVGEQIVAEARALNASGLVAYALTSNDIGDNVETQLLRDAIALLQRTVAARASAASQVAPPAAADASATVAAEPGVPVAERARPSRRP